MPPRGNRPFWLHQLVEYILGITLVSQALQSPTPAVPAVAGAAVLVNAAVARGPLGAFRLVSRSVHRVLDIVVMVLIAGLAVQPWWTIDAGARLVMVGIVAVHAFVWWQSDLSEPALRAGRARRAGPSETAAPGTPTAGSAADAPPAAVPEQPVGPSPAPSAPSASSGDRSTEVGRAAGRAVGAGVRAVRRWTRS
jgi:hypothetical protein